MQCARSISMRGSRATPSAWRQQPVAVRAPPCKAVEEPQPTEGLARRALLSAGVAAMAAAAAGAMPQVAEAFGSGFPGYDVNIDGRKRALERNKREMEEDRRRAAEWRAARDAKAAAKAAAAAEAASS